MHDWCLERRIIKKKQKTKILGAKREMYLSIEREFTLFVDAWMYTSQNWEQKNKKDENKPIDYWAWARI